MGIYHGNVFWMGKCLRSDNTSNSRERKMTPAQLEILLKYIDARIMDLVNDRLGVGDIMDSVRVDEFKKELEYAVKPRRLK